MPQGNGNTLQKYLSIQQTPELDMRILLWVIGEWSLSNSQNDSLLMLPLVDYQK